MSELSDFLKLMAEEKKRKQEAERNSPAGKALAAVQQRLKENNEMGDLLEVFVEGKKPGKTVIVEKVVEKEVIKEVVVNKDSFQQPAPQPVDPNIEGIKRKVQFLEQAIGKIAATGPGSGEVNFRYLDDVDASTIGPHKHLAYNPDTKKFFFEEVTSAEPQVQSDWNVTDDESPAFIKNKPTIPEELSDDDYTTDITDGVVSVINLPQDTAIGPIDQLRFDTNHVHDEERVTGTLCWGQADRTLNIEHQGGVTQQVGQENYVLAKNMTGSNITNGSFVGFAGASQNGEARILVSPFLANGASPNLYGLGVATQDILDGEIGFITTFGKVRGLNTTGSDVGETWQLGDILYASPTNVGKFTRVKPTAPNNVIPVAAVLYVHATAGEIFVRPTFEQKMTYGKFARTTDVTTPNVNTAYVVQFDTTDIANGVNIVVGNPSRLQVEQSGLYQVDISAQIDATGGGNQDYTMYMWIRKNGVDVPNSTRRQGVVRSAPSTSKSFTVTILLDANDYVEIAYAGDSTQLIFDASPATAFAPSTAAVKVGVNQIQL